MPTTAPPRVRTEVYREKYAPLGWYWRVWIFSTGRRVEEYGYEPTKREAHAKLQDAKARVQRAAAILWEEQTDANTD